MHEWVETNPAVEITAASSAEALFETVLDPGEAAALRLAEEVGGVLLIDEQRGRRVARKLGVPFLGTGGLLVAAKQKGELPSVERALQAMRRNGYRFSDTLCRELIRLAGES